MRARYAIWANSATQELLPFAIAVRLTANLQFSVANAPRQTSISLDMRGIAF